MQASELQRAAAEEEIRVHELMVQIGCDEFLAAELLGSASLLAAVKSQMCDVNATLQCLSDAEVAAELVLRADTSSTSPVDSKKTKQKASPASPSATLFARRCPCCPAAAAAVRLIHQLWAACL